MTTVATIAPHPAKNSPLARVMMRVTIDENGCWNWSGTKNPKGYGIIMVKGRRTRTHRVTYESVHGLIPEGLEPDHTCRNRACCNPSHLEAVTHAENNRRAGQYQSALKITLAEAQLVKDAYAAGGVTQRSLAAQFGISATLVNFIVKEVRKAA